MFIRVLRPVYKNSSPSWENDKRHLGPFQTSNFTCTESNGNEKNPLFSSICLRFDTCKGRRLKRALGLGDAKTSKMIVSKNFNHPPDVKFPCVKLIMTPVWPCHDPIHRVSPISHLYFWEEIQFKEIVVIFKMTEDAVFFLKRK